MKFSKSDINHSRNMLKALGKGEWKLDGMEILAFSDMMRWFANLQKAIETEVAAEEAAEKAKVEEKLRDDSALVPKPVEDPIKPIDASASTSTSTKAKKQKS